MGASLGLAGLTGCTRQPTEFICPYVDPPEDAIPGRPLFFATAVPVDGIAEGVIVETHLGRPTKVEGNPAHPASLGSTSVLSQASVLDLYDPDRAQRNHSSGTSAQTGIDFLDAACRRLSRCAREGARASHSHANRLLAQLWARRLEPCRAAAARRNGTNTIRCGRHSARAGAQLAFGRDRQHVLPAGCARMLSSRSTPIFSPAAQASTRLARDFAGAAPARRSPGHEPALRGGKHVTSDRRQGRSSTSAALPEWSRLRATLAAAVGVQACCSSRQQQRTTEWIAALSRDLMAHRGASAMIPGEHQSPAVHALAHAMNAALGNVGKTVVYTEPLETEPVDQIASLRDLIERHAMPETVELLLILGGNPAYDAPADLGFRAPCAR